MDEDKLQEVMSKEQILECLMLACNDIGLSKKEYGKLRIKFLNRLETKSLVDITNKSSDPHKRRSLNLPLAKTGKSHAEIKLEVRNNEVRRLNKEI